MKVGCVVLTVVLLANGCANRMVADHTAQAATVTGAVAGGVGLYMLAFGLFTVPSDGGHDDGPMLRRDGAILTIGGAVVGIAGLIAMARIAHLPPPPDPQAERLAQQRIEDHAEALQLTKECVEAASAGNCEHVRGRAPRVQSLDAVLYATVFIRHAAIAHCFETTPDNALEVP